MATMPIENGYGDMLYNLKVAKRREKEVCSGCHLNLTGLTWGSRRTFSSLYALDPWEKHPDILQGVLGQTDQQLQGSDECGLAVLQYEITLQELPWVLRSCSRRCAHVAHLVVNYDRSEF